MRVSLSAPVDPDTLAAQFTTALGLPVAVSTRDSGQTDDQDAALPGVVILLDPATGKTLPDQDPGKVAAVIAAHTIPVVKTPHRALADALTAAGNVADIKAALVAFAGKVAASEDQQRQHPQRHQRGGR